MRAITSDNNVPISTEIAATCIVIYSKIFPGEDIKTGYCGCFPEEKVTDNMQ